MCLKLSEWLSNLLNSTLDSSLISLKQYEISIEMLQTDDVFIIWNAFLSLIACFCDTILW